MRIQQTGAAGIRLTAQDSVENSGEVGEESAASSSANPGAYVPSSQFLNLVDLVRQQPEIRSDRVEAIRQKIQDGSYLTSASDEATAGVILESGF